MGARPEHGPNEDGPGPGHYKDPASFTQLNAPLGFINPDTGNGPSMPNYPGPGTYLPDDKLVSQTAPAYTFSGGPEKGLNQS